MNNFDNHMENELFDDGIVLQLEYYKIEHQWW